MRDPDGRAIPRILKVGEDAWVRLQKPNGEAQSFLIENGPDRPADGILSPTHPIAVAAIGSEVGAEFTIPSTFGEDAQWRVVEIRHKYLHALRDVMENFQARFPDAKGLY